MTQKIDYKAIGEKIKGRRNQLCMTQSDLAEKLEVTSNSIGKIERGENDNGGSVENYIKIAIVLELSLDELFEIEKQKPIISDRTKYNTIKDFIDFFEPELLSRKGIEDPASLLVNDMGIAYYIQEYKKILETVKEMNDDEMKERVKKLLVADLDKNVNELMEFDKCSLIFKSDKYFHFEYNYEENKIVIVENEIPF